MSDDLPDRPPFHECDDPSAWYEWPTNLLDDGRLLAFEVLIFGGRIYRHRPSNRRRPGGDPSKEYVAP